MYNTNHFAVVCLVCCFAFICMWSLRFLYYGDETTSIVEEEPIFFRSPVLSTERNYRPVVALYEDNTASLVFGNELIVYVAVWDNGRIVWTPNRSLQAINREYYSSTLSKEELATFFENFAALSPWEYNGQVLRPVSGGNCVIKIRGENMFLAAVPNLLANDTILADGTVDNNLELFLEKWRTIRNLIFDLVDDRPTLDKIDIEFEFYDASGN